MTAALRRNGALYITIGIVLLALLFLFQQYEPRVAVSVILSGLTLGALYFLVTSGLSLIFGLMDVLNFAHGLFFMLGAYLGYTLYANPRMVLNTVPLVLALAGAVYVGGFLAGRVPASAINTLPVIVTRTLSGILLAVGGGLLLWGVWGLDLLALAANAPTSTGGAIPTDVAQDPDSRFLTRLILLALSGLLLGAVLALNARRENRAGALPTWRGMLAGIVAFAAAVGMAYWRTSGETSLLNLPSDLRFVLALLFGAIGGAALGALVEWSMIRPLYARPIYQVLLTLGLVFVGTEIIRSIWGPTGYFMQTPDFFSTPGDNCPSPDILAFLRDHCSSISVLGRPFPSYRIFLIVLGIITFVGVLLLLRRTRMGMIIRAGVQDRDMVQALGINVRRVFTLVFALGTGLAALGGVAAAPFVSVNPGLANEFILLAFIAVVIGGMGSYTGAALGALLVGLARAFGDQIVLSGVSIFGFEGGNLSPSIARASTVLLMAVVLLIRPSGLFGKKE